MSIIALIHHYLSLALFSHQYLWHAIGGGERDLSATASTHQPKILFWCCDTTERAWAPCQSVSLSIRTACLMSVVCLIHRCRRWLSGAIAIMAYKSFSSFTTYRLCAAQAAVDLIRQDKNKLSVSLFVCLSLLAIFKSADVLRWLYWSISTMFYP